MFTGEEHRPREDKSPKDTQHVSVYKGERQRHTETDRYRASRLR